MNIIVEFDLIEMKLFIVDQKRRKDQLDFSMT